MGNEGDYEFDMFHQDTTSGISQRESEEEIYYLGRVFKIPYDAYGNKKARKYEIEIDSMIMNLVTEDGEWEVVDQGIIERHEVRDLENFDVWVMYRVPYRRVTTSAT